MASILRYLLLVSMVTAVLSQEIPGANSICLLVPPSVYDDCYKSYTDKPISQRAAQVACLQQLLWNFEPVHNLSNSDLKYFRSLRGAGPEPNSTYIPSTALPPSGYRVRREFRTLSDGERKRFHDALNKLYQEGVIRRFAELHARASNTHHIGSSFLAWNRVFLTMFEEALRNVDRHVFLPYWDCTIDDAMDNPVNSEIWTPKYFGTGTGEVTTGLGAGWVTHQGYLERDYGRKSRLMSKAQIRDIMSRCNLKDISRPTARPKFDIEHLQGGTHAWVGGDMAFPSTAGYDPIFYMHQAYVDYIWELFRLRQRRRCGVNPGSDYPEVAEGDSHHPGAPMMGFDWLTNRDGIRNYWIENWYRYETHPYCRDCCPMCQSPSPMFCDRRSNVCVSRSRRVFPSGNDRSTIPAKDEFLEMAELKVLISSRAPRNRGIEYDHPYSDGRTLATANIDAARANNAAAVSNRRDTQSRSGPVPDHFQQTGPRGSFSGARRGAFERPVDMSRRPPSMSGGDFRGGMFPDRGSSMRPIGPVRRRGDVRTGTDGPRRGRMVSDAMSAGRMLGRRDFTRVSDFIGEGAQMGTGTLMGSSGVSRSGARSGRGRMGSSGVTGREPTDRHPRTRQRSRSGTEQRRGAADSRGARGALGTSDSRGMADSRRTPHSRRTTDLRGRGGGVGRRNSGRGTARTSRGSSSTTVLRPDAVSTGSSSVMRRGSGEMVV